MSGGEIGLSVVGTLVTLLVWGVWYYGLATAAPIGMPIPGRHILRLLPWFIGLVLFIILRTVASFDVVNDVRYIYMYLVAGLAWTGMSRLAFGWFGIANRDDIRERRNPAAVPAVSGALVAVALCYAGGNIGDGPGWWVVFFAATIACAGLAIAWGLLEKLTHISDAVTIDRDVAAGWRLGSYLIGCGLILGRSVAGDWVSVGATIADAAEVAWPVLVLLVLAVVFERWARPTPEQPEPPNMPYATVPMLVYIGLAAGWIQLIGIPE